ncbi:MAG: glycosyltransferase family 2 protein [Paracoccaceae bacterium]|nr:glycosyltransferase family 2 protein [Paracoccaceae bacterium]
MALAPHLARHGIAVTETAADATAVLGAGPAPAGLPRIRVEPSWCAGQLRVTEEAGATCCRLERLFARFGPGLDAVTIHAALSALPDEVDAAALLRGLAPGAPEGPRDTIRRWLAVDALFNAVPPDPALLSELVADAATAVTHTPPRVSIVVNNHDYAPYLGAAIASALDQTWPAHEVIVVDDGSTDASREVIARYSGIRPVLKENGGQASALNAGFAAATGDLIVFLDADDRLAPEAVETLAAEPLDGVARLSFGLETIDAGGHPTGLFPMSRLAASGDLRGPLLAEGFVRMMPTSGNAFTRATLERLMPIPERAWRISADVYLVFGAAFLGEARHLGRTLGQYRLHGRNAYFTTMGTEAPYHDRKDRQRRQAFADIARRLARHDPGTHARDAADLAARAEPASPARRAAALAAGLRAPGRRLRRPPLSGPLSATRRDRPPLGRLRRHLAESDPARFGGPATWPILSPGEIVDLREASGMTPLGSGWRLAPGEGVALDGAFATLALRLPGPRADWTLRLATEGGGPLAVWINGMRHDPLTGGGGPLTARIAGDILEHDPATRTWRAGITLVPEGARPLVTELAAQRALPAFAGAPVLPEGRPVRPDEPAGRRCLGAGWHWPDRSGARMAAPRASLHLSVPGRGDHLLHIVADPMPLMAGLRSAAPEQQVDAQGSGLVVTLPAGAIPPSGLVEVSLVAAEGTPRPRLSSLRLLRLDPADPLPPGRLVSPDDLGAIEAAPGRLTVPLPGPVSDPLVLRLEREAADAAPPGAGDAAPVIADVGIVAGDRRVALRVAGGACAIFVAAAAVRQLELALPEGIRLNGIARHVTHPAGPRPEHAERLDPAALAACAEAPDLWHDAGGDGLWLGASAGRLHLPRPGPGPLRLVARVLALPGTGQRLDLRAGSSSVQSAGAEGPETLTLDIDDGAGDDVILDVATTLLVDSRLLGLEGGGLLGGALLGLALAPADARHASLP